MKTRDAPRTPRCGRWLGVAFMLVFLVARGPAADSAGRKQFAVPSGAAETTLKLFANTAGAELIYSMDTIEGVTTNAVAGDLTAREALDRMVANTPLVVVHDQKTGAFLISRRKPSGQPTGNATHSRAAPAQVPPPRQTPIPMKENRLLTRIGATVAMVFASSATADAQSAPRVPNPAESTEPVQLSVFEVTADKDVGYQAGNTVSGSRLNSSLKDTAAAVMVFTPEFIADFGANTLEDVLAYSPNMQIDVFDTSAAANDQFLGGSDYRETRVRVRGLSATTAVDFFETGIRIDNYNTERFELSSGPNSILFGFGSPGGLVNVMSKRAHVGRNRTALRTQIGEWRFSRFELDHNRVVIPGKLALRLNGVLQNSGGWRKWDFNDSSRGAVSLRAHPWKNTMIVANYEIGELNSHVVRPVNTFDAVKQWAARGSLTKSDAAWTAADRTNGINRLTATRALYITNADGSEPFVLTLRNAANFRLLESTFIDLNTPEADPGRTLVPASQLPFNYSAYGPGSTRDTDLDRFFGIIEQRLTPDITLELAYNRERSKATVTSIQAGNFNLGGDPNTTIPNPDGSATPVANPNAGDYFVEGRWIGDRGASGNDVIRGSAAWLLDLGKFGHHKLAGMAEYGQQHIWRYPLAEILVDESGVPISNANNPGAAANHVWRRHYVSPGNFSTYYAGNGAQNFTVVRNGRTYHNEWVANSAPANVERTMNTLMGVTQSSFWDRKIVVTAGVRWDRITFDEHATGTVPANDPEVLAGRKIANSATYLPEIADTFRYEPVTSTLGGVYHATRWLSLFYNHGTNNSQPPNNLVVLPNDSLPPPFEGVSDDYGFMLDLLDGRIFVRGTAYITAQNKSTGGTFVVSLEGGENDIVAPTTRILDTLLEANRITDADYELHLIGRGGNLSGTSDIRTRGYELSTWFNVTKNLTAVLNLSYSETDRSAIVPEFEGWFERENEFWHRTAGAGNLVGSASNRTIDQEAALLQRIMADIRGRNGFRYGERPFKANVHGRYSFTEGRLKGAFVGGGARWQDKSKLGRAVTGMTPDGMSLFGETYYGPENFKMDAFIGYRRRVSVGKHHPELTVQLNVTNLTDEDEVMPLRYNADHSGYARVLLFEPRRFRLTAGLAF